MRSAWPALGVSFAVVVSGQAGASDDHMGAQADVACTNRLKRVMPYLKLLARAGARYQRRKFERKHNGGNHELPIGTRHARP